jgi:branched-chain amino acid transport system permease protein
MLLFLEQCLNGLQFGLLLFLLAAGLTLVFGIMDMVNLAHGSLYMVGAYFAATFVALTDSFVIGAILALGATVLVGMAVEVVALRRLYGRDHLDHVLGTFGLILFFNEAVRIVWGPAGLTLRLPDWLNTSVRVLPGLDYPTYRIAIIVTALLVALFLYVLVMRTRVGMLIRAGATNREMTGALGVNIGLLYTLVFGLGAALAALRRPDAGADPDRADRHGREHSHPRPRGDHHRRHRFDPRRFIAAIMVRLIDTIGRAFLPDLLRLVLSSRAAPPRWRRPCPRC